MWEIGKNLLKGQMSSSEGALGMSAPTTLSAGHFLGSSGSWAALLVAPDCSTFKAGNAGLRQSICLWSHPQAPGHAECHLFFGVPLTYQAVIYVTFFFPIIFIGWRLISLQYCSGFCHTLTWISHGFTCVPHPEPPSHLPPHPIPLGHPNAPPAPIQYTNTYIWNLERW